MPRQITPFNQAAQKQFMDLLLYLNPKLAPISDQITLGEPQPGQDQQISVPVTLGSGYRGVTNLGSVDVSYSRLDVADYFQGVTKELSLAAGTDDASLLAQLLDRYQLYFTAGSSDPADPRSQVLFDVDLDAQTVTMSVTAHHLFFEGSVVFALTS